MIDMNIITKAILIDRTLENNHSKKLTKESIQFEIFKLHISF